MNALTLVASAAVAAGLLLSFTAQADQPGALTAPSADALLTAADLGADGRSLVTWKSFEPRSSTVVAKDPGGERHEWNLPGVLVQDAHWTLAGFSFSVSLIGEDGPEDRIYRIDGSGDLVETWSSRDLEADHGNVMLSQDGSRWMASTLDAESAHVTVGVVGKHEAAPATTWTLTAEDVGAPEPFDLEMFSYAFFTGSEAAGSGNPGIGILWGGRLWVTSPTGELMRVAPPSGDCVRLQAVHAVDRGLWLQCYRGLEAKPAQVWAYYSTPFTAKSLAEPALLEVFRSPHFLADGTVVDVLRREGRAEVYDSVAAAGDDRRPTHLGTMPIPTSRLLFAGDLLLEDTGSETYLTHPLRAEIASLRATKPQG
jgi:hypothetical protein